MKKTQRLLCLLTTLILLLAQLPAHEDTAEAILIEAEMPEKAEDAAMAVRRLGFYSRCVFVDGLWFV